MKIAIHNSKGSFSDRWIDYCQKNNIPFKIVNAYDSDIFEYESPLGFLGICADKIFLKSYMTKLLVKRNDTIKEFAESDQWKTIIEY